MSPSQLVRVSILGAPLLMAISAMGFVPALALDPTLAIDEANSLPLETVQETVQETVPIDDALSLAEHLDGSGAGNHTDDNPAGSGTDTAEDLPVAGFVPVVGEDSTNCEEPTNDSSGSSSSSACSGVAININISNNSVSVGGGNPTNNNPDDPADEPDDDPQGDGPDTDGPDGPVAGTVPSRGPGAGSQGDGPPGDLAPRRPGQVPATPPPGTVAHVNRPAQPGLDVASNWVAQPAAVDTARSEPAALTELSRTGADIQQATLLGLMLLAAGLVTRAAGRCSSKWA